MRRSGKICMCLCLLMQGMTMLVSAQQNTEPVVEAPSGEEAFWCPGRIVMRDSSVFEHPAICLPRYVDHGLYASDHPETHLSIVVYNPDEVAYIEVWNETTPRSVSRLYSVLLEKRPSRRVGHYWGVEDITAGHGMVAMVYACYRLDEEGKLVKCRFLASDVRRRHRLQMPYVRLYGDEFFYPWPGRSPKMMADLYDGGHVSDDADPDDWREVMMDDDLLPQLSAAEEGAE